MCLRERLHAPIWTLANAFNEIKVPASEIQAPYPWSIIRANLPNMSAWSFLLPDNYQVLARSPSGGAPSANAIDADADGWITKAELAAFFTAGYKANFVASIASSFSLDADTTAQLNDATSLVWSPGSDEVVATIQMPLGHGDGLADMLNGNVKELRTMFLTKADHTAFISHELVRPGPSGPVRPVPSSLPALHPSVAHKTGPLLLHGLRVQAG